MQANQYKYLKFVRFRDVERWDLKSLVDDSVLFKFPKCRLNKILSEVKTEWVDIKDDFEYPILGVHAQGGGVYINKIVKGKELTMKRYQKSVENALFYCKVRTVNGQWGIVFPEFSDSYGSSNMQYLNVSYDLIDPHFFMNLLKIKRLTSYWDKNAIGADGRHFTLKTLLQLQIPLPTLSEQQALVEAYNAKIKTAEEKERRAEQLNNEIEDYLLDELGIKLKGTYSQNLPESSVCAEPQVEYCINPASSAMMKDTYHWGDEIKKEYRWLKFVRFKDVDRWDCYNIENVVFTAIKNSYYPAVEIGKVFDFIKRSWGKEEKTFRYVELSSVDTLHGIMSAEQIDTSKAPSRATQKIKAEDLIIGTTRPYLKKFAIVNTKYDDCVCSSGFQVVSPSQKYNLYFLYEYLLSQAAVSQFEFYMTGALYPAITNADLRKILIPLPPLEIQNTIVKHITGLKEQIKQLKQEAKELRENALVEFEKEIFEN